MMVLILLVGNNKQMAFQYVLLQDSLFKLSGEKVVVYGAGRTDAGVHAYGQVASFQFQKKFLQT